MKTNCRTSLIAITLLVSALASGCASSSGDSGTSSTAASSSSPSTGSATNSVPGEATGNKSEIGNSIDRLFGKGTTAVVEIPVGTDTAEVLVEASSKPGCVSAVKAMRVKDWSEAKRLLESTIAASPKDWRSYVALAVVGEVTGDLAAAKANYIKANQAKSGDMDPNVKAGLDRLQGRTP